MQINYFENKVNKLMTELPPSNQDPLKTLKETLRRWGTKADLWEEFEIKEITIMDTIKMIGALGNSTTMVHDEIEAMTLKLAADYIYGSITHVINLSVRTDTFCNK